MGSGGIWNNLKNNLERSKAKVAKTKADRYKRIENHKYSKPDQPLHFTTISLLEKRNRLLNKIRLVALVLILLLVYLVYSYL